MVGRTVQEAAVVPTAIDWNGDLDDRRYLADDRVAVVRPDATRSSRLHWEARVGCALARNVARKRATYIKLGTQARHLHGKLGRYAAKVAYFAATAVAGAVATGAMAEATERV